jgi:hypothetical protein
LALATTVRGEAWIVPDDEAPVRVGAGAVALVKGPNRYIVADDPSTPAQIVVGPGNRLYGLDGNLPHPRRSGVAARARR